ncbi:leishmanolysin-related zinc metalloendopeptidase [Kitasatospora sp. NPDC004240]
MATPIETYRAVSPGRPADEPPFSIELRFRGGLTENQKSAFKHAADQWARVIVGALPAVDVDRESIENIVILVEGVTIDSGRILGQSGPTHLRAESGPASLLPAKGIMMFDRHSLMEMEAGGTLVDVITHEMGHVLGIGILWEDKGLLRDTGTPNPTFVGPNAMSEYAELIGAAGPTPVPVESEGGPATANNHWRWTVFRDELMSGFLARGGLVLSRVTAASLKDLGYEVDLGAADPYELPDLLTLAQARVTVPDLVPIDAGTLPPVVPVVLRQPTYAGPLASAMESPSHQSSIPSPSEELRQRINAISFEREEDCFEALVIIDSELGEVLAQSTHGIHDEDLLAAVDEWASLISYVTASTYAPHSPMMFPGWSHNITVRLQEMCDKLRRLLVRAAEQAQALNYSIGVAFPWGIQISLGWSTPPHR